jgi:predicted ATPase
MKQTEWCVITGAPCSGKTSVIRELQHRGYQVVEEAARRYINGQLKKGRTLQEIKADVLLFEKTILYRKLDLENTLPPNKPIFLDRAVPDSIAYYIAEGLNPSESLAKSRIHRYRYIFLFDRLRLESDRVRSENEEKADKIDILLEDAYRRLGYDVLRIPVMPVKKRTDNVLSHLETIHYH